MAGWDAKGSNIASKIGMDQNKNMWDEKVEELDIHNTSNNYYFN